MHKVLNLFSRPLEGFKVIIIVIAVAVIFAPQVTPNDHQLNVEPLVNLLNVYDNDAYVYPPHALIFMLPLTLVGDQIIRMFLVIIVGLYALKHRWSIARFLFTILNPIFIYAMLFSNLDLLIILIPVLLYRRSNSYGRAALLSILLLKPQMGVLLAAYYVFRYKEIKGALLGALITLVPFILQDASGSPLMLNWIDNIINPTDYNAGAWTLNPVGPRWLVLLLMPIVYYFKRKNWTEERTIAIMLILAMVISPYASFQSVLVPITMLSSGWLTMISWGLATLNIIGIVWYFVAALIVGDRETEKADDNLIVEQDSEKVVNSELLSG